MRRRLFNLAGGGATALSLLVCLLAISLRVRAHYQSDDWLSVQAVRGSNGPTSRDIRSVGGWLILTRIASATAFNVAGPMPTDGSWVHRASTPDSLKHEGPSVWHYETIGKSAGGSIVTIFAIRLLPLIGLSGVLPGWWLWRRLRRRTHPGCCTQCGYDLRATPEQGGALLARCPECGTTAGGAAPQGGTGGTAHRV